MYHKTKNIQSVLLVCFLLCLQNLIAQKLAELKDYNEANVRINKFVEGSLVVPYAVQKVPLLVFIMDAGAVNRDGDTRMSRNKTFKILADTLAKKGLASFRYDKRILKINRYGIRENAVSFDQFVQDAKAVIRYFRQGDIYKSIVLVGHGQGALVGILAAEEGLVDAYVSLQGHAQSIDDVIIEQLSKQAPGLDKKAAQAFEDLKTYGSISSFDPALGSIFRQDLQPFMKSWLQYTPSTRIQRLRIPILIIHGDKDIQVPVTEAEALAEQAPNLSYLVIQDMNHIFRKIKGGRLENHKSYNEPWRPVVPELIAEILCFVNKISKQ